MLFKVYKYKSGILYNRLIYKLLEVWELSGELRIYPDAAKIIEMSTLGIRSENRHGKKSGTLGTAVSRISEVIDDPH
jgi:hypothetical protein